MKKIIDGFNGRYQIEDNENIYSNGKLLKPYVINSGYLAIQLHWQNKKKHKLIHRLVAEYFIPNPNGYDIIDHIDGNRLNNNSTNLRWCTQKQNLHYHGYDYNSGLNNYKSYLTKNDIINIRNLREQHHLRNCQIYPLYPQVSHTVIDNILNYHSYKNI